MRTKRRQPNSREKLAAVLLALDYWIAKMFAISGVPSDLLHLAPYLISYEEAKKLTADQIISRFEFDHYPVKVFDQAAISAAGMFDINQPANLTVRHKREHREKTAKVDQPAIAKTKRITKKEAERNLRNLLRQPSRWEAVALSRRSSTDASGAKTRPAGSRPIWEAVAEIGERAHRRSAKMSSRPFAKHLSRKMSGKVVRRKPKRKSRPHLRLPRSASAATVRSGDR